MKLLSGYSRLMRPVVIWGTWKPTTTTFFSLPGNGATEETGREGARRLLSSLQRWKTYFNVDIDAITRVFTWRCRQQRSAPLDRLQKIPQRRIISRCRTYTENSLTLIKHRANQNFGTTLNRTLGKPTSSKTDEFSEKFRNSKN